MARLVATVWFSLLLLGMQHHLLVHEIGHLGVRLDRGADVALHNPSGPCLDCSLLAGGSNVVPLNGSSDSVVFHPASSPVDHPESVPPQVWRTYYLSRAPPRSRV